jgi:hypothetical protein
MRVEQFAVEVHVNKAWLNAARIDHPYAFYIVLGVMRQHDEGFGCGPGDHKAVNELQGGGGK